MRENAPEHFVHAVCRHPKWSLRKEVQIALLKNEHTPLSRAVYFAGTLSTVTLRDVIANARLRDEVKEYVEEEIARRKMNLTHPSQEHSL